MFTIYYFICYLLFIIYHLLCLSFLISYFLFLIAYFLFNIDYVRLCILKFIFCIDYLLFNIYYLLFTIIYYRLRRVEFGLSSGRSSGFAEDDNCAAIHIASSTAPSSGCAEDAAWASKGRSSGCASDAAWAPTGRSSGSPAFVAGGGAAHIHELEPRRWREKIDFCDRHQRLPLRRDPGGARRPTRRAEQSKMVIHHQMPAIHRRAPPQLYREPLRRGLSRKSQMALRHSAFQRASRGLQQHGHREHSPQQRSREKATGWLPPVRRVHRLGQ